MFQDVHMSSININSCRVCLETVDKSGFNLGVNEDLLNIFKFFTDLTVLSYETAKMVCRKCSQKIRNYAKFKRKCLNANEIWKSLDGQSVYSTQENMILFEPTSQDNICPEEVKTEDLEEVDQYDSRSIDNGFCEEKSLVDVEFSKENNDSFSKKFKKLSKPKKCIKPKTEEKTQPANFCGLCTFSTEDISGIKDHLGKHWSDDSFKCMFCNFTSQDAAVRLTHRFKHNPTRGKFCCHMCDKRCASVLSLEFHYRSVHLQMAGGSCMQCKKTFRKFVTWKKHCRLHKIERFICDYCGKKFLYRHQIEGHLIDHSEIRNFICETCGKGFKRKFNLKTHLASVHSSKTIKCAHCDKVFKSEITFNDHMKAVNAEKPFVCVLCRKGFRLESALRSHMFWHTGERPHVCQVCGLKYKSKGQLKVHERNHTGYMPYKCKECEKCFTNSQSLKRHQSVHTGKRAHRCSYCERTFHERKSLQEHYASNHKDKLNDKLEPT